MLERLVLALPLSESNIIKNANIFVKMFFYLIMKFHKIPVM